MHVTEAWRHVPSNLPLTLKSFFVQSNKSIALPKLWLATSPIPVFHWRSVGDRWVHRAATAGPKSSRSCNVRPIIAPHRLLLVLVSSQYATEL